MKNIIASLGVLALITLAYAEPSKLPLESRFQHLDKSKPDYERNVVAICVDLVRNIRRDTLRAASLQDSIDEAKAQNETIQPGMIDELKSLDARLAFDNAEYSAHCL